MSKTAVIFLHWKSLLNADVVQRELFVTQSRSYLDHLNPARGSLNELFRYQPIIFCQRENITTKYFFEKLNLQHFIFCDS